MFYQIQNYLFNTNDIKFVQKIDRGTDNRNRHIYALLIVFKDCKRHEFEWKDDFRGRNEAFNNLKSCLSGDNGGTTL